jgi:hypothetical protein
MQPDEPSDLLRGLVGGAETLREASGGSDPGLRVGLAGGLPDVVEHGGEHQRVAVGDPLERLGRPGLPPDQLRQLRSRVPAVPVEREAVVRVALGAATRGLPLRQQRREHPRVVELRDRGKRRLPTPEDPEERRTLGGTEAPRGRLSGRRRSSHASGAAPLEDRSGPGERLEQPDGDVRCVQIMVLGDAQHAVDELERTDLLLRRARATPPSPVEVCADERPRPPMRVVDRPRVEREPPQQPVGCQVVRPTIDVAESPRDVLVELEADGVVLRGLSRGRVGASVPLRAHEVERDPRGEQALLGAPQPSQVGRTEEAGGHERLQPRSPDERGCGPAQ